ncbi:MAG: tyrosine-type recombinase/integrase [Cellulomonadaceae bacterium]|jgi:integrase|nr:tyrosine-type recombinase/integrase [Cellulomonadaceae bacterium]
MRDAAQVPAIRFKGFTDAWEQRKLGEVAESFEYGLNAAAKVYDGEHKYLRITDIDDQTHEFNVDALTTPDVDMSKATNYRLQNGDVLFARTGASVGKTYRYKDSDGLVYFAGFLIRARIKPEYDSEFVFQNTLTARYANYIAVSSQRSGQPGVNAQEYSEFELAMPGLVEQRKIGSIFARLDHLITLHQREPCWELPLTTRKMKMKNREPADEPFSDYYARWINVYKKGAIRDVTMQKYAMTHMWLCKLAPHLGVGELTRTNYQQLLNDYAEVHERQTTMDFHHQLKGAILDALDDGLLDRDPTRKAIVKGKTPRVKKQKYLNQFELHSLLMDLELKDFISWDWFLLLVAKTGMRFSEALGLTPRDFDFAHQSLSINKTWDYKGDGGYLPTKNTSSNRKLQIDWQTVIQFSELVKSSPLDVPLFVDGPVYNSTVNDVLHRHCLSAGVPVISIHGLRHTHASLLLFAGVSTASVARRLGHASMTTTQKTYLHIIRELENQDVDLVMRSISGLI